MRYLPSFRTSLRLSRDLFRILGLMLWGMGVFITLFFLYTQFNESKSDIRQQFYSSFENMQAFILQTGTTLRSIQFMTEQHEEKLVNQPNYPTLPVTGSYTLYPLSPEADCVYFENSTTNYLTAFEQLIYFWKDSIAAPQGLNHVFVIGSKSYCMMDFSIRTTVSDIEMLKKIGYENIRSYQSLRLQGQERNLYTVVHGAQTDSGQLYLIQPIYVDGRLYGFIGLERTISLNQFNQRSNKSIESVVVNAYNQPVLYSTADSNPKNSSLLSISEPSFFGFNSDYSKLIFKKRLTPSLMTVIYAVPTSEILAEHKVAIFYSVIINIITGGMIFFLILLLERKMLIPAANTAIRLEEHEQFNHKIVASAPVGIIILRLSDGGNILSNELAHDYFRLLSEDDKQRILTIIRQKSSNYIDVVTTSSTHLQISFVNSRYQNEDVAICVLIDISIRVQMEKSLQDVADAAEQANHAKSMFLATVSHELRTPLYGIIGNIELLQRAELSDKASRLVTTMDNSSSLLLQIISDILDFSKIESKQLKIENKLFNCRDVFAFVLANYLPLIAKKQIAIYSFIEPNVPDLLLNDSVRLQQVISNIVNNSIKFTDSGFVIFYVWRDENYLKIEIKDSGIGMSQAVVLQLFDPFFQVYDQNNVGHKGTGLGLAICEKLISLMDGDIEVNSQTGLGSSFIIRIPLYGQKYIEQKTPEYRFSYRIAINCQNQFLADFLAKLLRYHHFVVFSGDEIEKTESYDLLITDSEEPHKCNVKKEIQLSGFYVGDLREIAPNKWLYNTYQNEKLPFIIDKVISKTVEGQVAKAESIKANSLEIDGSLSAYQVLIVDDHPINRVLLSDQIANIGFCISTAVDGLDALKYLENHTVDIVLTDVNMPNMDGYELAKELRKRGSAVPIIALTANAMADEKQRCIDSGMNDCLSKPTKITILKETLLKYVIAQ
ncbi:two-component system sensor histidine kinase RcsC [Providencia vermicola]|uniref:Sensor histidine kinase RcsC n=1 Tax=Providencia stuartii TaxID=588 RepID=A0ABD5L4W6_PROST|nr:two-component system sensor histidine kinase RcsC [Providencia sp. PROV133]ELR5045187.1 two-component system sensor histidine kinase RcsC [Providencia rettgeri]MCR4179194.1 two-component system sensor histidine kinase RcsC [Providencia vermicola]